MPIPAPWSIVRFGRRTKRWRGVSCRFSKSRRPRWSSPTKSGTARSGSPFPSRGFRLFCPINLLKELSSVDNEHGVRVESFERDPFSYLGPHQLAENRYVIRTFLPAAKRATVLDHEGSALSAEARRIGDDLYEFALSSPPPHPYRLRVAWGEMPVEVIDPYQFGPWLGETDLYLFREGTHVQASHRLGAHCIAMDGVDG